MTNTVKQIQLDEFTLYPAHNKITKGDLETKIEPKIMQVLCFLIEHQGQVFSRQQIADALWPGTVVSLEVVTRAIFELRKVLGDSAQTPKYIETIARKGYCFIFTLEQAIDTTDTEPQITSPQNKHIAQTKSPSLKLLLPVVIALVFGLLVLLINQSTPSQTGSLTSGLISSTLTSGQHQSKMPSVNPDETQVLFVEALEGNSHTNRLVLMDIETRRKQIVAENAQFVSPRWKRDGSGWIYAACSDGVCQLYSQESVQREATLLGVIDNLIFSFDLHPSNEQLVVSYRNGGSTAIALYDYAQAQLLPPLTLAGELNLHPRFHPNGNSIYYVSRGENETAGLNKYDLVQQQTERISSQFYAIFNFAFKSLERLWITGKTNNKTGIWLLELSTNTLTEVTHNFSGQFQTELSAALNSNKVLFKNANRKIDIGQQGLELDYSWNSDNVDIRAIYSTQHDALFYVSNQTGTFEIWKSDQVATQKLTSLNANSISQPILSQSQDRLFFLNKFIDDYQLMSIDLTSGEIQTETSIPKQSELLNHSHKDMLFLTLRDNEQYVLARLDLSDYSLERIQFDAGAFAHQQEDAVYFINLDLFNLSKRHPNGSIEVITDLSALSAIMQPHYFALNNDYFYYVARAEGQRIVRRLSLSQNRSEDLFILPSGAVVTQLGTSTSPFVIYDYQVSNKSEIVMLETVQ